MRRGLDAAMTPTHVVPVVRPFPLASPPELYDAAVTLLGRAERLALSTVAARPGGQASGRGHGSKPAPRVVQANNSTRSRLLAVTLNNFACVYNEMGQPEKAIESLQTALRLDGALREGDNPPPGLSAC